MSAVGARRRARGRSAATPPGVRRYDLQAGPRTTRMEHVEFAYTGGMDDAAIAEKLSTAETGVLALASDSDAYAVPLAHYYDGAHLYFRVGSVAGSEKAAWLDDTATATYVLYGTEPTGDADELESWSVVARGPLRELDPDERERFDTAEINRRFSPIRVFDETVEDVEIALYELEIQSLTGRKTVSG